MGIHVVRMPKLGMTMREGTVVAWPIAVGERVERGAIVLVIESEKAEVEIDAHESGFLRHHYVAEGETVPCGTLLAVLTDEADEPLDLEAVRAEHDTPEAPPAPAPRAPVPASAELAAAAAASTRRPVAPAAKARARELGIDVEAVAGTGPGGRVTRADVEAHAASRASLVRVADGVSLEVPLLGEGDEVLLLPGFGTDVSSFAPLVQVLSSKCRVRAMNPRGIGASNDGGDAPVTPKVVAEDAAALLVAPAHVVGASVGAAAAVELAIARPDLVRSLVLVTPCLAPRARLFAVLDAWTKLATQAPAETVATALMPWLFSEATLADAARRARIERGLAAMTGRIRGATLARYAAGLGSWSRGPAPDLSRVTCPVLVVEAAEDLLTPDAVAVARAIPGSRLVTVAAAGHAVALDAPEEVGRAVASFLDEA